MKLWDSPLFRLVMVMSLGVLLSEQLPISLSVLLWTTGLGLLALALLYTLKPKGLSTGTSLLIYLMGLMLGVLSWRAHDPRRCLRHYSHWPAVQQGLFSLQKPLRATSKAHRWVAEVQQWGTQKSCGTLVLRFPKSYQHLAPGQVWAVHGQYRPAPQQQPDEGFDYGSYMRRRYWFGQFQVYQALLQPHVSTRFGEVWEVKRLIEKRLRQAQLSAKDTALLMALLFGEQTDLDPQEMAHYQKAGIVHILSVSGMHVGFVVLLVQFLTRPLGRRPWALRCQQGILLVVLLAFGSMAQWAPPVLRAIGMVVWVMLGQWLGRPVWSLQGLTALWGIIIACQPNALFDLSLQLSFAALVGICLFQPLGHQAFQPQHRIMRWVWEAVLISVAAQLGTLPLCLYYFHQFPMYFLIANLAILPLMGVLMGGCLWAALWALCAAPPSWLIHGLHGLMQGMNFIAEYIGQWPASVITDIPCSKGLALWLTVGVLGLWYMAKTAPTKRIIPIMSWLVFGLMIQLVTKLHTGLTSEWRIVQLRQYSALLVREGFQVRVYTDAPPEVWKSTNMWKAYCLAHQGVQLRLGPLPQAFRTPQGLWLAVDDAAPLLTRSRHVQGIWLRNNAKIHLEWLLQQYHPNTVVIDPSNKPWLGVQWQQKIQELGIRCHYMGQQGSYTVPLR